MVGLTVYLAYFGYLCCRPAASRRSSDRPTRRGWAAGLAGGAGRHRRGELLLPDDAVRVLLRDRAADPRGRCALYAPARAPVRQARAGARRYTGAVILLLAGRVLGVPGGHRLDARRLPARSWRCWRDCGRGRCAPADILPTVTFLIPAHNEQAVIERKLENTLALDYPRELMEIVVASDASSDAHPRARRAATPTAASGCWTARAAARCRRSTGRARQTERRDRLHGRRQRAVGRRLRARAWCGRTPIRRWGW